MQKIHVNELKIGDRVLKLDASWLETPFLSHKFKIKDLNDINKLKKHGIEYVFIEPRNDMVSVKEVIEENKDLLENVQYEELPKHYIDFQSLTKASEIYEQSVKIIRSVMEDIRAGKLFDDTGVRIIADKITELTVKKGDLLSSAAKLKSYDDYTFQHCVNVSVFATSLGKLMNLPSKELNMLSASALLHDVGKMLVPKEILNKPGKLTDEEFKIMKNHVTAGYDYLIKNGLDPSDLKIVIEHHERYDGSGYPYGLKDPDISLFGKIGAVVDIYDAITSDRVYHKGMEPPSALKMMFKWTDTHINKKIFEFFITHIGIYPVGTLVLLNTNELAIVAKITDNPTAPIVAVFKNPKGEDIPIYTVDLSKKSVLSKKIIGPVNPEKININKEIYDIIERVNEQN
ncbi:HD-GYP domain-containing protein [Calditerrivibrio nitroreducens]|uniref:Metal dependent phosphohydrolase n=1 Tax=Calditerrivibrio nitroreducens (strain DSM 19672 / NBRC 101217 / Yu37-1) TaxID=768670 RepID=E4TK25_CALNY|nr:HD-GYP domain-containing protein [Calditerrivibrio nitroreducens]ADR19301.1 metal dependent phosphohydrolase [Calditerrivibrio nitroreducens DSM 19672]